MATKGRKGSPNGPARKAIGINLVPESVETLERISEEYDISKSYVIDLLLKSFDPEVFAQVFETEQVFASVQNMSPEQIEKLKDLVQRL